MIGQKALLQKLSQYTIDSFPHSVLLLGEKGCGKHLLTNHIAENLLHLPLIDITEHISDEYIDAIYQNPNPHVYIVDMTRMMEKEQNVILKFLEEPLKNAFILLLAENKNLLLETIANRCVTFQFEAYSNAELMNFLDSGDDPDFVLSIIHTPGKLKENNLSNLYSMKDLCLKMIEKMQLANYSNVLSITNKINFKDEYDKFDLEIFFDMLAHYLVEFYKETRDEKFFNLYLLTNSSKKKLNDSRINKESFMYNFLTSFWKQSQK